MAGCNELVAKKWRGNAERFAKSIARLIKWGYDAATTNREGRSTALLGMSARDGKHAAPPFPSLSYSFVQ